MFGYRHDLEDLEFLHSQASDLAALDSLCGAVSIPDSVSQRDWLTPRNQGDDPTGSHVNSCVGHGAWAAVRILNHLDGGQDVDPSPLWLYLAAQLQSGYFGGDHGAAISGARKALEQLGGGVLESLYPYSNMYPRSFPDEYEAYAGQHKLLQHSIPRNPDDVRNYIGTRKGVAMIGVPITTAMRDSSHWTMRTVSSGSMLGMHCMTITGYAADGTFEGINSWGEDVHERGFWTATPDVVQHWIDLHGSEVVLLSDIVEWRVREYRCGMLTGG